MVRPRESRKLTIIPKGQKDGSIFESASQKEAPRGPIGTGEEPGLSSQRKTAQRSLRSIVGHANSSVMDKAGEALPSVEQIVDRLDHVGGAREPGAFRLQPSLKTAQQRRASLLANPQPLFGT
jgi:hypothetical protein